MNECGDWIRLYASYDDESLAMLASAGLLRRAQKDVEAGNVALLEAHADHLLIVADEKQVRLDAGGLVAAKCACPIFPYCKHRLAAALFVRGRLAEGMENPEKTTPQNQAEDIVSPAPLSARTISVLEHFSVELSQGADAQDSTTSTASGHSVCRTGTAQQGIALAEILALDPQQLQKAAGKAASRKALQWLIGWSNDSDNAGEANSARIQEEERRLRIELPELGTTVIYLAGAGFAGMISEISENKLRNERNALHLVALARVFQAQGQSFFSAETVAVAKEAEATANAANATHSANAVLSDEEKALLDQVDELFAELIGQGLAHVSPATALRLRLLNLSARVEGLPRLAAHLRTLSGLVSALATRDDHSDEAAVLLELARVNALIHALRTTAGSNNVAPDSTERLKRWQNLRGQLRRDYQPGESLELFPLGGWWWKTPGGARGLTMAFWNPASNEKGEVLEATNARPDGSDFSFTRLSVWQDQSWWKSTPRELCQAPFVLHAPRLSSDGRLAVSGETFAQVAKTWPENDQRFAEIGIDDWRHLDEKLAKMFDLSAAKATAIVLHPARCGEIVLDEVRQRLLWEIKDRHGARLVLEMPCSPQYETRALNLERLVVTSATSSTPARQPDIRAILTRVDSEGFTARKRGAHPTLQPLALLVVENGQICCHSLDFVRFENQAKNNHGIIAPLSRFAERLQRMLQSRTMAEKEQIAVSQPPNLAMRIANPLFDILETQADTGRLQISAKQREILRAQAALARATGLDSVATAIDHYAATPEVTPAALLRLAHILDRLQIQGSLTS